MYANHLGRKPGAFTTMKASTRHKVQIQILESIEQGMPFQSACWAAEVDPEEFQTFVDKDKHLYAAIQYRRAKLERKLLDDIKKGGRGLSTSKAALEILGRSFASWAPKSNATLAKQFEDALADLEKILDEETFEKVVRVFDRHS